VVQSERHYPKTDSDLLNKTTKKAIKDRNFGSDTVEHLKGLQLQYRLKNQKWVKVNCKSIQVKSMLEVNQMNQLLA
jgi:hypothetical protein